ncbi:alpha/beta-hydrolase [Thozetella sp. PMI_491]|nr:alpha/beta-hydrolase [Thozetella sp. PMI_491]
MLLPSVLALSTAIAVVAEDALTCSTWLLGDDFGVVQPHHGHMDLIWNDIWRPLAVEQNVPFYDANVSDFDPIFADLIEASHGTFTEAFFPTAESLAKQAEDAEKANDTALASALYSRAAAVLRIARYPNPITPQMWTAWRKAVEVYFKGSKYLDPPVYAVDIPHTHAANGDGPTIPVAVRHPTDAASGSRPVLLFITGLDQFRPDFNPLTKFATDQGWEVVVVEIPGTGDCPSNRTDPVAGDRLWDSVLDWIGAQAEYDASRIGVWTFSTGSYYGVRMAHTHADRLHAVVTQGGAVHKAFQADWILQMDGGEDVYRQVSKRPDETRIALLTGSDRPTPSLMYKWGYDTLEDLANNSQADHSLVLDGTLEKNCTTLLMINGMHDSFFPAEDTLIPLDFGWPKMAKVFPGQPHMGGAGGFELAQSWLRTVM